MTVCTDVYVRPQTCDAIYIYPSQVHPTPSSSGGGGSRQRPYIVEPKREKRKKKEDDLWVILLHQNLLD